MHSSLLPKTNLRLIGLWAIAGMALAVFTTPVPWLLLAVGALLGTVSGIYQRQAMRASSAALRSANTSMEIRHVLKSSSPGRTYLFLLWISMLIVFGLAFWQYRDQVIVGWMAGYATYGFAREAITLRGTFELQAQEQQREQRSTPSVP
jgi:hypothetical protein